MTVAVVSDIHDNIWNLEKVITRLSAEAPEELFFLGDFCAPFTLAQLADGFSGPIHVVFGNNDGDTYLLSHIASQYDHVTLYGQLAELTIEGATVALNHYPDIAAGLADSGKYRAVFSGHDHKKYILQRGSTLWANPGEVMGRFGEPSFGMWDSASNEFRHVPV
ncbi:MAG: metallophosphoesterase family protein [Alkalispirochaeta sp.]